MIVYKPFMEFKYQATLGKMALDIKIKSEDGNPLFLSQILKRALPWLLSSFMSIYIQLQVMTSSEYAELEGFMQIAQLQEEMTPGLLNGLITLFFFASVITVAFNARKKGLHDMIAGTVCVIDKEDDGMSG